MPGGRGLVDLKYQNNELTPGYLLLDACFGVKLFEPYCKKAPLPGPAESELLAYECVSRGREA